MHIYKKTVSKRTGGKTVKIPSKLYDFIKWILIIVVPAFITLFTLLSTTWHWDIPTEAIVATITGIATFVGVIVGISTHYYNKGGEEE